MFSDQTSTIKDLQQLCHTFREQRGWKGDKAATFAKAIAVEAGELLDHFVWEEDAYKDDPELRREICYELADVLYGVLVMADILEADLATTLVEKIKILEQKYPAAACRHHMETSTPKERIKWYSQLRRNFIDKSHG